MGAKIGQQAINYSPKEKQYKALDPKIVAKDAERLKQQHRIKDPKNVNLHGIRDTDHKQILFDTQGKTVGYGTVDAKTNQHYWYEDKDANGTFEQLTVSDRSNPLENRHTYTKSTDDNTSNYDQEKFDIYF